jgi:hypothetical protein
LEEDKRKAPGSFIKLLHQQERKSLISQDKFGPQPRMHVIGLEPLQLLEAWRGIERGIAKKKKKLVCTHYIQVTERPFTLWLPGKGSTSQGSTLRHATSRMFDIPLRINLMKHTARMPGVNVTQMPP